MAAGLRKATLAVHIACSVGWFGAVAAFFALAIAGLIKSDAETMRAAYLAMEMIAWSIIVPLSFASPLTGIIQALGTAWGLFRHYWILIKFFMTVPATAFLLLHMQVIDRVAGAAAEEALHGGDLERLRLQLAADSGAALIALLVTTTLAVFKPPGITPHGARKRREQRALAQV